ncbi:MAG: glycosyl transferase [Clostridia bacterium]|nr:glycosyl transferase [Clostridia bacterium]
MIPKRIHYCWFGRGEKPKLVQKCIESWQKHLPDYTIIEWNEDNFDVGQNTFVRQAYAHRNFAFVSDYARAKALYNEGGIYLDTDVEVLGSFDPFLHHAFFAGFEEKDFVGTCVMGAEKGCALLEDYMAHYDSVAYEQPDGTFYSDTNVVLLTRMLEEKGFVRNNSFQEKDGIAVYPREWFSPYDYINSISYITEDSRAIHHFAQLWLPKRVRMKTMLKRTLARLIGGERIRKLRGR